MRVALARLSTRNTELHGCRSPPGREGSSLQAGRTRCLRPHREREGRVRHHLEDRLTAAHGGRHHRAHTAVSIVVSRQLNLSHVDSSDEGVRRGQLDGSVGEVTKCLLEHTLSGSNGVAVPDEAK